MVELTLFMPIYNSKHIGWLPLEGFIRQKEINFEWEFIIVEENNGNEIGKDFIMSYSDRLKDVGCVDIKYVPLNEKVPLCKKISIMSDIADPNSRILTMGSSDCYPSIKRLISPYNAFKDKKINWYCNIYDIMYDIKSERYATYNVWPKGTGKACLLKYVRNIPQSMNEKNMDNTLLKTYTYQVGELVSHMDETDNWKTGFNTNGLNNISDKKVRHDTIKNYTGIFSKCEHKLEDNIPIEILDRLKECKKYINY